MRSTTTILFLLFTFTAFCQVEPGSKTTLEVQFDYSEVGKAKKGAFNQTIGSDDDYEYGLEVKGVMLYGLPIASYKLTKMGEDLEIKKVKFQRKTKDFKIGYYNMGSFTMMNDRLYHMMRKKKKKRYNIYITEFDKSSFFIKRYGKVASYSKKTNNSVVFMENKGVKDEIITITKSESGKKNKKTKTRIAIHDPRFKTVFKTDLRANTSMDNMRILDPVASPEYLSFMLIEAGREGLTDELSFHRFAREGDGHIDIAIDFSELNKDICSFDATLNEDSVMHIAGFFEKPGEKTDDVGGIFTMEFDLKSETTLSLHEHNFNFDFLTENLSDRQKAIAEYKEGKDKDFDKFTYKIRHVLHNEDSTKTIVGEAFRTYQSRMRNSNGDVYYITHFVHADLIYALVNKSGEIEWVKRYKKYINSTSPEEFILHDGKDSFHVLHEDERKVYKLAKINKLDGTVESEEVLSKETMGKYQLSLNTFKKDGDHIYEFNLLRGKKQQKMTVNFGL